MILGSTCSEQLNLDFKVGAGLVCSLVSCVAAANFRGSSLIPFFLDILRQATNQSLEFAFLNSYLGKNPNTDPIPNLALSVKKLTKVNSPTNNLATMPESKGKPGVKKVPVRVKRVRCFEPDLAR